MNLTHDDVLRMSRNFKKGQRVSYTKKEFHHSPQCGGYGTLTCVWMAMDTICFDVVTDEGCNVGVFPELGDSIAHEPEMPGPGTSHTEDELP
jgi:hypothetical protein